MNTQDFQHAIQRYLAVFRSEERYFDDDEKRIAYFKKNPRNEDASEVLMKISTMEHRQIDQLIPSRQIMADHIAALGIDEALQQGAPEIVDAIAHLEVSEHPYFLYSFATRYCNWHTMEAYPIYDPTIHKLLTFYRQASGQADLLTDELYHYPRFKELMVDFRQQLGMEDFNYKEIDKFVWINGDKILRDVTEQEAAVSA